MPTHRTLRSNHIEFSSHFQYAVRGTSETSKQSRDLLRDAFKQGRLYDRAASAIARYSSVYANVLGPDKVLVPVPRSAPLLNSALWPALGIAQALVDVGLGASVERLLKRQTKVSKSSFIQQGEKRPQPGEHYASLAFETSLLAPRECTLIDDIVTRGSTFLGAAWLLEEHGILVRAFALCRAISQGDVTDLQAPCTGTIRLTGTRLMRSP